MASKAIFLIVLFAVSVATQSPQKYPCIFVDKLSLFVFDASLSTVFGPLKWTIPWNNNFLDYWLNPCGSLYPYKNIPDVCGSTSFCQFWRGYPSWSFNLGYAANSTWVNFDSQRAIQQVTDGDSGYCGEPRTVSILWECSTDPNVVPQITDYREVSTCHYAFNATMYCQRIEW
eukprot:TRINITY_DN2655_c0_g1_i2.p1 TRINITY_DN2655_c0_g1~~TRINITY_DN2655_c0_g1_i2.p1  ORF type:complete len:173 (-),score=5.81 TRINITY_DN2655_c0_g1_i2:40-558(-)